MNPPENGRYEMGHMKAQLEALQEDVRDVKEILSSLELEIRRELGWMRDEVTTIKLWRAKVIGAAMVGAALVSWLTDWLKAHVK